MARWLPLITPRGGKCLRKYEHKRHLAISYSLGTKPIPALPELSILSTSSTVEQLLAFPKLQLKSRCLTGSEVTKTTSGFVGAEILHCGDALMTFMQKKKCPVGAAINFPWPYPQIFALSGEPSNLRLKCWGFLYIKKDLTMVRWLQDSSLAFAVQIVHSYGPISMFLPLSLLTLSI